ncbi:ANK [Mytilus edulis]|uniref:ANK n=1 Tax=Mytilus edulis TaxID=6550 RepID=A0A8S3UK46_MYTED|nr:ANK [Mytilus edulis]
MEMDTDSGLQATAISHEEENYLRNLAEIQIGDKLPFPQDKSADADLTRLKYYRNKVMHSDDGTILDNSFNNWWDEISQAIIRIGGSSFEEYCNSLKVRKLDSDEREIRTEINNIRRMFDTVPKGIRKIYERTISEWEKETVAETRAIRRLAEMIAVDNIAVAVGPSGCGKSTAIHYIALQLAVLHDYDILIVCNVDEMRQFYNPDSKQVFVIDDVVGAGTFNENKARKWLEMSNDINIILEGNRVKLLASSRTHIFQERMIESINILSKYSLDFASSDYCLTLDDRTHIANIYLTTDEILSLHMCEIAKYVVVSLPEKTIFSLLMSMMDQDFRDIIIILLTKAMKLDQMYWDGETPLFKAACKGYLRYYSKQYIRLPGHLPTALPPPLPAYQINDDIFEQGKPFNSASPVANHSLTVKSHLENISNKRQSRFERNELYRISPLQIAASKGNTEIVQLLLCHNAETDYDTESNHIASPLYIASNQGFTDIVHLIINSKSNFDEKVSTIQTHKLKGYIQSNLRSSLHAAVEKGHSDIVSILLDHKLNLDHYLDHLPKTTQHVKFNMNFYWDMVAIAIVKDHDELVKSYIVGSIQTVKLLLKHNSNPNICNKDSKSPLHIASWKGHTEIVKLLLEYKSDPNILDLEKQSVLHVATYRHRIEIVKLLLQHKVHTDLCNDKGQSALYIASVKGLTVIVKLLLESNCDMNLCNEDGESPLFAASSQGWCPSYLSIVKLLLDHNCNPNVCNKDKKTPLIIAAKLSTDVAKLVKLLLDHNSDPNLCDKDNCSPLL